MDDMAMGYVAGNIDENTSKNRGSWDFSWPLLTIAALFAGEELKEAMMKAVEDKAKEAMDRAKQSIPEIEQPAADAE